jgi:hypothetical protein
MFKLLFTDFKKHHYWLTQGTKEPSDTTLMTNLYQYIATGEEESGCPSRMTSGNVVYESVRLEFYFSTSMVL